MWPDEDTRFLTRAQCPILREVGIRFWRLEVLEVTALWNRKGADEQYPIRLVHIPDYRTDLRTITLASLNYDSGCWCCSDSEWMQETSFQSKDGIGTFCDPEDRKSTGRRTQFTSDTAEVVQMERSGSISPGQEVKYPMDGEGNTKHQK
jgi:hypothetical protein